MKFFIGFIAIVYVSGLLYDEAYRMSPRLALNNRVRFLFLFGLSALLTFAFYFLNKL